MRRKQHDQPVSDINITPLTDVMLVLLVIFMISSPVLLAKGMEVHLPQVSEAPSLVEEDHVLYLTEDLTLSLDGVDLAPEELYGAFTGLVAAADESGEVVNLFFRADESVTYGDITAVMDLATQAGIERISLVQEVLEPGNGEVTENTDTDGEGIPGNGE
jgi:biopolymer transport protein TolR